MRVEKSPCPMVKKVCPQRCVVSASLQGGLPMCSICRSKSINLYLESKAARKYQCKLERLQEWQAARG